MSKGTSPQGALATAALAMEAELRRLESQIREASALPLTSRRNLERTAERLRDLGDGDQRLQANLAALSSAIAALGEQHRAALEALQARVDEYARREAELRALLDRHERLGSSAGEVNASLKDLVSREGNAVGVVDVEAASARLGQLIEEAAELTRAALAARFEDVAREGHALRQQLLSSRNKLELLRERLAAVSLPS